MNTPPKGAAKKYDGDKLPVYSGFFVRFPRAIYAVTAVSVFGATKYEVPVENVDFLHLEGGEMRYRNAQARHQLDEVLDGPHNPKDGMLLHLAQNAWDAMAALERVLLEQERRGNEQVITDLMHVTLNRQLKNDDLEPSFDLGDTLDRVAPQAGTSVLNEDAIRPGQVPSRLDNITDTRRSPGPDFTRDLT